MVKDFEHGGWKSEPSTQESKSRDGKVKDYLHLGWNQVSSISIEKRFSCGVNLRPGSFHFPEDHEYEQNIEELFTCKIIIIDTGWNIFNKKQEEIIVYQFYNNILSSRKREINTAGQR